MSTYRGKHPPNPDGQAQAIEEAIASMARKISAGADLASPARYGALSVLARRLVLRLNRHSLQRQEALNTELARTIILLQAELESLKGSQGQNLESEISLLGGIVGLERRLLFESAFGEISEPAARWGKMIDYTFTARWDRNLPGGLGDYLEAKTKAGPMLIPAKDKVITPELLANGSWEPAETELMQSLLRPGMTFMDIGAHVGYHAITAAKAVGPTGNVVAIEPSPGNFALLCANLALNKLRNVFAIPACAWRTTGNLKLALSELNTGDNRVALNDDHGTTITVPSLALSEVLPDQARFDLLKIDAQGADHIAVQGMEKVIARDRPVMMVEFWPPGIRWLAEDPAAAIEYYRDLGYSLKVLDIPNLDDRALAESIVEEAEANRGNFVTFLLTPKVT